jgi:phage gp36-like protein
MAFLKESDYDVQIRSEISKIIDASVERSKIKKAEDMAIAQMRNHLAGRFDIDAIFIDAPADGDPDTRDQYIVMLAIDIALYHLWTKEGPNNIPKTRELRYNDALKWLQDVQGGAAADLPIKTDDDGTEIGLVKIWSQREPEDQTY